MRYNVNHKNYFNRCEESVKEVVEKTEEVVESTIEPEDTYTEEFLFNLTKKEQVDLLEELGLDKKEVRDLTYEEDRVQAILNLVYNEVE